MAELADRVADLGRRSAARNAERRAEIAAAEAVRAEAQEQKRADLRETMPRTAALVDEFRAVFGPGVRVLAALEDGRSVINRQAMARLGLRCEDYETRKD